MNECVSIARVGRVQCVNALICDRTAKGTYSKTLPRVNGF